MIQPMSVIQQNTPPAERSNEYATSLAVFTRNPAWVCTAPFGRPVVPDVYASSSVSPAVIGSGSVTSSALESSSSHRRSLHPATGGDSVTLPITTTCSTVGQVVSASSSSGRISTVRRRRTVPSATITAFASASCNRAAIADGAKPENNGTTTAPSQATA